MCVHYSNRTICTRICASLSLIRIWSYIAPLYVKMNVDRVIPLSLFPTPIPLELGVTQVDPTPAILHRDSQVRQYLSCVGCYMKRERGGKRLDLSQVNLRGALSSPSIFSPDCTSANVPYARAINAYRYGRNSDSESYLNLHLCSS